jgi:hypothetical protein
MRNVVSAPIRSTETEAAHRLMGDIFQLAHGLPLALQAEPESRPGG